MSERARAGQRRKSVRVVGECRKFLLNIAYAALRLTPSLHLWLLVAGW